MDSDAGTLGPFGPVPGPETFMMGSARRALVHFGRMPVVTVGRQLVYVGDNHGFDISARAPLDGGEARHITRPFEPIPVTEADLDGARRTRERVNSPPSNASPEMARRLEAMVIDPEDVPARETHPSVQRMLEDGAGNLWVEHRNVRYDESTTWSVFDANGTWLGEVGVPRELHVQDISAGEVVAVALDDLGVPYVRVHELLKPEARP